jgi:hypothetical protein
MAWGPFIEPIGDWLHSMCTLQFLLERFHAPAMVMFNAWIALGLPPHGDAGWGFMFGFLAPLFVAIQWTLVGLILGGCVILIRKTRTQPTAAGYSRSARNPEP